MGRTSRLLSGVLASLAGAACASAPPRPTPAMNPDAAWGLVHFVQALNDPAGTRFTGWSARLLERGPEPAIRRKLADMHQQFGECELKKLLEVHGTTGGQAALRCSRGILTVQWAVDAAPPHELESLGVKDAVAIRWVP